MGIFSCGKLHILNNESFRNEVNFDHSFMTTINLWKYPVYFFENQIYFG